jgi:N-dimethylarginine dimethylaminohydrolase
MSASKPLRPARGCNSETGQLKKVVVCPPTHFRISVPTNATQWLYYSDGLGPPDPRLMTKQHQRLVEILREEGVEVEVLDPHPALPYQHATRDVGVVIGDRLVLSNLKHWTRQPESEVLKPVLEDRYGLKVIRPTGFVEGGDVIVDGKRLWVGIGARTNEPGAEFLYKTFGRDHEVLPLRFDPRCTHLDTVLGVLGGGRALVYEPAFDEASLRSIRAAYPDLIPLTKKEQENGGANVLFLGPERVISIAENSSVNAQLVRAGFEVVTLAYSEVIKSGGSVRCDTLPVERDSIR